MNYKKSWGLVIILFVLALLIHAASANSLVVEKYYSLGIYPFVSALLRYVFGWLPFSIGDILYGACAGWLIYKTIKLIVAIFKKKVTIITLQNSIRKLILSVLWIYIIFNLLWGINYNRIGIADQIGIKLEKYSVEDVLAIDSILLVRVNESKLALQRQSQNVHSTPIIKKETTEAYKTLSLKYSFLNANPVSLKPSLWGWLGNYLGFVGYYNPFTGEAQVNTTVPVFSQPFTFCHETSHQLGYAKENEANFVGYLAAVSSADTAFHYSVYLDLFLYAQRNLYFADSAAARTISKKLSPAVKADLADLKKFNDRHQNPFEPVVRWMYGAYLKSNQQPSGVLSYDEVVGFLIAYYKRFGYV